jgi:hypothetical protein
MTRLHDGHGSFRRNARRISEPVFVEHRIATDNDAQRRKIMNAGDHELPAC